MDSNLKVGSNNAGLFVGNIEILGGITVDYEDGFFNDNGSACIIINNSQETKFLEVHGRTVDVASNCISFYMVIIIGIYILIQILYMIIV